MKNFITELLEFLKDMDIFLKVLFFIVILIMIASVPAFIANKHKKDMCLEKGGVYVRAYGYKGADKVIGCFKPDVLLDLEK